MQNDNDEFIRNIFTYKHDLKIEAAVSKSVKNILDHSDEVISQTLAEKSMIKPAIQEKWGDALKLSWVTYRVSLDSVVSHFNTIKKDYKAKKISEEQYIKYFVIMKVHGKICQTYQEIMCLLENGFPEGAIVLSRVLLELCCTEIFIYNDSSEVAKEYMDQSSEDNLCEWARHSEKFKDFPPKQRITNAQIVKKCGIETLGLAEVKDFPHRFVHSSSKTVMYRLSHNDPNTIMTGPTIDGLEFAGINSTTHFHIATLVALDIYRSPLSIYNMHQLIHLISAVQTAYIHVIGDKKDSKIIILNVADCFDSLKGTEN